jgi:dienelactone hydrolase
MKKIISVLLILITFIFNTMVFASGVKQEFSAKGLTISGDPTQQGGAKWSYKSTDNGVLYDINGVIIKPSGEGVFPAVILSHGKGGNATDIVRNIGSKMLNWGVVVISVNYTHAREPLGEGSPGKVANEFFGSSDENILRASKCIDILESLPYVDKNRIAAHGHSMGAFITAGLVGTNPSKFVIASHTAGGLAMQDNNTVFATKLQQAKGICVPYLINHGVLDKVVNIELGRGLFKILEENDTDVKIIEYPDLEHANISSNPEVLENIRKWYEDHNFFNNRIEVKLQINKPFGYLNGKKISTDVPAEIISDRTFLPVRFISELLKMDVKWDEITQIAKVGDINIVIGENNIYIGGQEIQIDAPALIKNGRTMLPLRALAEALQMNIGWDEATQTVILKK